MNFYWSPEAIETAKRLYVVESKSAAETARALGRGVTRNSVIGKAHRMGWYQNGRLPPSGPSKPAKIVVPKPKPEPKPKVAKQPRPAPPKPGPQNRPAVIFGKVSVESPEETAARRAKMTASGQAIIAEVESATTDNPIRLMDRRTFQCAWPTGVPERPADQMCCGQTVPQGGPRATPSYCPTHSRMAIGAQPKREVPTEPSIIRRAA